MRISEAKNYDMNKDYAIVCKNCGHVRECHEWDDYTGESCIDCTCKKFEPKFDGDMIIYDLD